MLPPLGIETGCFALLAALDDFSAKNTSATRCILMATKSAFASVDWEDRAGFLCLLGKNLSLWRWCGWSTHCDCEAFAIKNPRLTCRRGYQFWRCIWEDEINAVETVIYFLMLRRNIDYVALQERLLW